MFGPQEIIVIAILFLLIFGPSKLPQMARDVGRFVGEARRSIDEFKEELTSSVDEEDNKGNSYQRKRATPPAKKTEARKEEPAKEASPEKQPDGEEEYDF